MSEQVILINKNEDGFYYSNEQYIVKPAEVCDFQHINQDILKHMILEHPLSFSRFF